MKTSTETIIIGAGAAGIGCARELARHKKDFLIITENVGGRISTSTDGEINYGAYFVLSNYTHLLPLVKTGRRLHPFFVEFHGGRGRYHLIRMCRYPIQMLRLLSMLWKFKSLYEKFKHASETDGQKQAIESQPSLKILYTQSASDFVQEKNISEIANRFLAQGIFMCTFLPLSKISAFDFMRLSLALLLPAYEFTFLKEKAVEPFKDEMIFDSVVHIQKIQGGYEIQTKKQQTYTASQVVVATPTLVSQSLLHLQNVKGGADAYLFHIAGDLKREWRSGQFELFDNKSPVVFIRKQRNHSYIFYSKIPSPNLDAYFLQPRILFMKHWDPAFNIIGNELFDCKQDNGLYLVGDHNVIGLEDAYITGLHAARTILKSENQISST